MRASRRLSLGLALATVVASGSTALYFFGRYEEPIRSSVVRAVPRAAALFATRGEGFSASPAGAEAHPSAGEPGRHLSVTAPARANGKFQIGSTDRTSTLGLSLARADAVDLRVDHGSLVYRDAYPHTDVVAVHDPDRFEFFYVLHEPRSKLPLSFSLSLQSGATLRAEPTSGAVLVVEAGGRPTLRIEAPKAIDARGTERSGTYEIEGSSLRIALKTDDLVAPVVLDPAVSIPYWTIASDGRAATGAATYDASRLSLERHMTWDSTRNRAVAVRPIRGRQFEDYILLFGTGAGDLAEISAVQHQSATAPTLVNGEASVWQSSIQVESETWEWDGAHWALSPARLPGYIDPALAFDAKRGRTVLYGGAPPSYNCSNTLGVLKCHFVDPSANGLASPLDAVLSKTWEYDGASWQQRQIAGSPSPRLRASMAWEAAGERTLLFGGRSLSIDQYGVKVTPYTGPFPETLTLGLNNDLWAYDGEVWQRLDVSNPPPAREGAAFVYDPARKVTALVGGNVVGLPTDTFDLWEFNGMDWNQRIAPGSPTLPPEIRTRRGATVYFNPIRQRLTIFGGHVDKLSSCTLDDATLAQQKQASAGDPLLRDQLAAAGCLGGYLEDSWEWDGAQLTRVAGVTFGGYVGAEPVFPQAAGASAWATQGPASAGVVPGIAPENQVSTPLWPWRYDGRKDHFQLRTTLELAHKKTVVGGLGSEEGSLGVASVVFAAGAPAGAPVSPVIAPRTRPQAFFDVARGRATMFLPDDARILSTDGAAWSDDSPESPFSVGANDFFAATWDTAHDQIVLFDPRTAFTWTLSSAGVWAKASSAAVSPPVWSVDPSVHEKRDLDADMAEASSTSNLTPGHRLEAAMLQMPQIAFDRTRGRAVMVYSGATWEWDGSSWSSHPAPAAFSACKASLLVSFDGARQRTVAFGCTVPGATWEWDGQSWTGPGPGPYRALVHRGWDDIPATSYFAGIMQYVALRSWDGTLQLAWAHPNSVFESLSLGGVSTLDADGTLRTWNGADWTAGPALPDGAMCAATNSAGKTHMLPWLKSYRQEDVEIFFPLQPNQLLGHDFLPLCFFPPVVENRQNGRLLAFRDGPRGMMELRLAGFDPLARTGKWSSLVLGDYISNVNGSTTAVNPFPIELVSAEHAYLTTQSDAASRVFPAGVTPPVLPAESWRVQERRLQNLWWPYRLLSDPIGKRVKMLTNRGLVWELGTEQKQGLGETCNVEDDCGEGSCNITLHRCMPLGNVMLPSGYGPKGVYGPGGLDDPYGGLSNAKLYDPAFWDSEPCNGEGFSDPLAPGAHCSDGLPDDDGTKVCDPTLHCAHSFACAACGAGECAGTCFGTPANPICMFPAGKPCGAVACKAGVLAGTGQCSASAPACVPGGSVPCAGGLGCADATTCKQSCTSRLDCASRFDTCDVAQQSCGPDAVATLAQAKGVIPTTFVPAPLRDPEELAVLLAAFGYPRDAQGNVLFPHLGEHGAVMAYDPAKRTPATGFRQCIDWITTCMEGTHTTAACVAAAPRCISATPGNGDPAGADCCPEACLSAYLNALPAATEEAAVAAISDSPGCYPGIVQ